MEPPPIQQDIQNKDANCRLRHGLNNHCLAEIFQYLKSVDLYTVSGMNKFYAEIIDDLIIPHYSVNFYMLFEENITISQVFERFGRRMRKFFFYCNIVAGDDSIKPPIYSIGQLMQLIALYCSSDQIKNVEIWAEKEIDSIVDLPNYFRNVEKFGFFGKSYRREKVQLSVSLTESLRCLILHNIKLEPYFDWKILKNLTKLTLSDVEGVNESNFIEYLQQRPRLETFGHSNTFDISTMGNMFQKMAEYCGNQIRALDIYKNSEKFDYSPGFYRFISGFKNLKKVYLRAELKCGEDLIDPIKRLAEQNTVEDLSLTFSESKPHRNCIYQEMSNNHSAPIMKPFTNMKIVRIRWEIEHIDSDPFNRKCTRLKLLTRYSSQILSNAETIIIACGYDIDWDFIKSASKLRQLLYLDFREYKSDTFNKIVSSLESILHNRRGENINDAIELKVYYDSSNFETFNQIIQQNSSIKLSKLNECDRFHLSIPLGSPYRNRPLKCN